MSIEIKHLSFRFGETEALKDLSLRIADGEFLGIMGQTGCGKTTLIQLIAGLIPPHAGQILLDGADINHPRFDRTLLRKRIGLVFQYPETQLFETTVERDVAFSLKHSGLSGTAVEQRVQWALEEMGFCYAEIRKRSPLSLSGGEKRRVAIAGVLAADPDLLIFDEPIAGLDPIGRAAFAKTLKRLNAAGKTVLVVSHNADVLCELADRILVLKNGALAADGPPDLIFADEAAARALHVGPGSIRRIAGELYQRGLLDSPVVTDRQTLIRKILRKAGERL